MHQHSLSSIQNENPSLMLSHPDITQSDPHIFNEIQSELKLVLASTDYLINKNREKYNIKGKLDTVRETNSEFSCKKGPSIEENSYMSKKNTLNALPRAFFRGNSEKPTNATLGEIRKIFDTGKEEEVKPIRRESWFCGVKTKLTFERKEIVNHSNGKEYKCILEDLNYHRATSFTPKDGN